MENLYLKIEIRKQYESFLIFKTFDMKKIDSNDIYDTTSFGKIVVIEPVEGEKYKAGDAVFNMADNKKYIVTGIQMATRPSENANRIGLIVEECDDQLFTVIGVPKQYD